MIKSVLKTSLAICIFAAFTACSESTESSDSSQESEETTQEISEPEVEEVEESPFGNFADLVGEWSVDAATAGIAMNLTFGEDGSFKQSMGSVQGIGTWERVDDEHINIQTQNTNGKFKKWKVENLTDESVDLTWNLDRTPKTIPMTRVK